MRASLKAVLAAAMIAGLSVPILLFDWTPGVAQRPAADASTPVVDPSSDERVYLAAEQVAQTRDPKAWPMPIRSLLRIDHPLEFGQWVWNDRGVTPGRTAIRVDLGTQLISVIRDGHEIGTSVILYGGAGHATPFGRFPIMSKAADYHSRTYDAAMPYALRLTDDGVAIHGSQVVPGRATHGCIGLPIAFARLLFDQVKRGDMVLIVKS